MRKHLSSISDANVLDVWRGVQVEVQKKVDLGILKKVKVFVDNLKF